MEEHEQEEPMEEQDARQCYDEEVNAEEVQHQEPQAVQEVQGPAFVEDAQAPGAAEEADEVQSALKTEEDQMYENEDIQDMNIQGEENDETTPHPLKRHKQATIRPNLFDQILDELDSDFEHAEFRDGPSKIGYGSVELLNNNMFNSTGTSKDNEHGFLTALEMRETNDNGHLLDYFHDDGEWECKQQKL